MQEKDPHKQEKDPQKEQEEKKEVESKYQKTDQPWKPDMNSPVIRQNFPMTDRFVLSLNCCQPQIDYITQTLAKEPFFTFDQEFKKDHYKNLGLKINVKETGSLVLDPNVTHPFVRVHIVDLKTSKYLAKKNPQLPGSYNKESVSLMSKTGNFYPQLTDFIMPVATRFFDMRIKGQTQCSWDESFIINELAQNILQPHIVIFFEILECNPMLIAQQNCPLLNHEKLLPIAWAYLRPLGTAHIHLSRSRLQLYRYKMKNDKFGLLDVKTPDVLLEFNWPRKEKYPSFLEVELSFCNRSVVQIDRKHFSRAPWEREIGQVPYIEDDLLGPMRGSEVAENVSHGDEMRLKSWEKFLDMPSMLPNMRVWKFDTEDVGAYRLQFSNMGKYLAVACTMQKSETIIKIFNVEVGAIKIVLRGHRDLIHDLSWSADDNYLVSASADGSAKVWDLSKKDIEYADKLNYTENDSEYFHCQLPHSSYVYAARIYPQTTIERSIVVVTACFDGKIRLWSVKTDEDQIGATLSPAIELSLSEKPQRTLNQKQTIYETERLDDEALALILNPHRKIEKTTLKTNPLNLAINVKTTSIGESVFDKIHPNCLTLSEAGRLYVGDSRGTISCWDVSLRYGQLAAENHFKIISKELEGDQINAIVVHPEHTNQLYVHSRDNCIRLIEYESSRGVRIKKRFFGSLCKDLQVRSDVSPDGQYLIAGSEDGKPRIWDTGLEQSYRTTPYECKILDLVSDCNWNPRYNMFALSGFGQRFPVLVYVYQRTQEELDRVLISGGGIQIGSERAAEYMALKQQNDQKNDRQTSPIRGEDPFGSKNPLVEF